MILEFGKFGTKIDCKDNTKGASYQIFALFFVIFYNESQKKQYLCRR